MNKKYLVFLLLFVIGLSACSSRYEQAQKYFANGKEYYDSGQYDFARIEFQNAIQRDPGFSSAYYYLGLIAKSQGRIEVVYEMMSKAAKLDASNADAILNVAELMLLGRQFDLALEHAEVLTSQNMKLFDAYRLQAAAYIGKKSYGQAEVAIGQASQIRPNDPSLMGLRAIIAKDRGKLSDSLEFLKQAIDHGEDREHYLLLRSKIHRDTQNIEALKYDLRLLIEESPGQENYVFALAKILSEEKKLEESKKVLEEFISKNPKNFKAKQLFLDVVSMSDENVAESILRDWIGQDKNSSELKFYKARKALKQGDLKLGKSILKDVIEHTARLTQSGSTDNLKARAMLAEVLLKENKASQAGELLQENLTLDESHEETLMVLSDLDLREKNFESAIATLHRVLRKNPESERALLLLGRAHVANGSYLLADDAYRQVLQINPTNQFAAIPVANTLIDNQDLERSENVIERVLLKNPEDAKLIMFYIRVLLLKEDWKLADKAILMLSKLPNTAAPVAHLNGVLLQARGDCVKAITYFHQALEIKPNLIPAFSALGECYSAIERDQEFLNFLARYKDKYPSFVQLYDMSATVHLKRGESRSAIDNLREALTIASEWEEGYIKLAGAYNQIGDFEAAKAVYNKGIKLLPESAYLKTLLASFLEARGERVQALAQYAETIESHPDFDIARNNYVSMLLSGVPTKQAKKQAMALAQAFKNSDEPRFLDTYGLTLLMNDRPAEAEVVLRIAAEKAPKLLEIQLHFAQALYTLERYREARVVLNRATKSRIAQGVLGEDIDILKRKIGERLADLSED